MAVIRTGYNSQGTPCSFLLFSLAISQEQRAHGGRKEDREADFTTGTAELPVLTKTNTQESPDFSLLPLTGAKLETKIGDGFILQPFKGINKLDFGTIRIN